MTPNEEGAHSELRIEAESGRFAVYLDVCFVDDQGRPTRWEAKRIQDYATRRQAEVAGQWMLRGARRRASDRDPTLPDPGSGT